jgi:Protein of unknown function, DUF481
VGRRPVVRDDTRSHGQGAPSGRPDCALIASLVTALTLAIAPPSFAQGRTDVVTLANGDHITGEVVRLERGRLEFKTDDAGTLYLEWDKIANLVANRFVEVLTSDGQRHLGTLGPSAARSISVVSLGGPLSLPMSDVTLITPIGRSFWSRIDGSIDLGYNYTRSSGVAQFNLNSDTVYRRPASSIRLTASATVTQKDDDSGRDDRGTIEASYLRYPWQHWFIAAAGRFETNESLGLVLRSQIGAAVGPRLINSTRAQMTVGAGLAVNEEHGVDVEPTQNLEGLLVFRTSYYTYDRPKTNVDISLQYYPSLSNTGRQRLQADVGLKRELWKDFFASLTFFNTFDSRPPNPSADQNDIGFVLSLGWSY